MATTYKYVFAEFKDKITDPDLLLFAEDLQTEFLISYLKKAIGRCHRNVECVDLCAFDDEIMEFKDDIPYDIIDILTEWMTVFWLQPYVNNIENLRNSLSTKDFSTFSPANLLEKIEARFNNATRNSRSLTNEYSYIVADMKELKS